LLGVGRSTMYELVRRGDVSALRLGRKVLITRSTLEALLGFPPPTPAELEVLSPPRPLRLAGGADGETPTEGGAGRGVDCRPPARWDLFGGFSPGRWDRGVAR